MEKYADIMSLLPYRRPFHFVDSIEAINSDRITGSYRVKEDEYFFEGHFPENPVVPGAIISEVIAQIGLVCFGLFLTPEEKRADILPAFTSVNLDFLSFARPGDNLFVESKKIYFRFGKLKCSVICRNEKGIIIAKGDCAGVIIKSTA
ncbi:MAG: 3-hydroxyacyl-ACP dehydratase FabZ family protein [Bacteroidota bacterium]